ncbi:hypothetical protein Gotur_012069, partial [Gossypium turneri]
MFGGQERTESEKRLDGKYFVALRDRDWYWRAFFLKVKTETILHVIHLVPAVEVLKESNFQRVLLWLQALILFRIGNWLTSKGSKRLAK